MRIVVKVVCTQAQYYTYSLLTHISGIAFYIQSTFVTGLCNNSSSCNFAFISADLLCTIGLSWTLFSLPQQRRINNGKGFTREALRKLPTLVISTNNVIK